MSQRGSLPDLIFNEDEAVSKWVAMQIPHVGSDGFGPCRAIGIAKGGRFIGGIVYHDHLEAYGTLQISMAAASPMWARRETIYKLLHYPFRQLGVFKVWTATPVDGEAALRVNKKIGFKQEAVLGHHLGRGRHCVIMRMLEPDFARIFEHG